MTIKRWLAPLTLFVLLQPLLASAGIEARVPVVLVVNNYGFDSGGSLIDTWVEHVYEERDGRIWFANAKPVGRDNGPTLASLDTSAAAHETNLFFMVLVPD